MTPKVTPTYPRGVSASCLLRYIGLLVLALLLVLPGRAAEAIKAKFDLPAGAAEKTLKQFSAQAGREVLFGSSVTKGVKTNPVSGEFTPREALEAMLADTGLMVVADEKTGSFSVRKETSIEAKNVKRAIAESGRPDRSGRTEIDEKGEPVVKLDTFEVMGSKLLNMDKPRSRDGTQPYVIFDRLAVERSGALDIESFLKTRLTMNAVFASGSQLIGSTQGNQSQINLRGLGSNQTLVLVDGHRMASVATGFTGMQPDLNGIPLSAIERIEVLPSTASAIYGGGATGGVINVVLKRDYAGTEVKLTYDNTFDTDSSIRRVDFSSGMNLFGGKTNLLVSGSMTSSHSLLAQDRDFIAKSRELLIRNAPDLWYGAGSPPLGATTNIRNATGANLVLKSGASLNSPITYIPYGYSGVAADGGSALIANAGKYNAAVPTNDGGGGGRSLYNQPALKSISATLRTKVTTWFDVFAEFGYSENKSHADFITKTASATLSAAAPNNPFTDPILVAFPLPGFSAGFDSENETTRFVVGAIVRLGADWTAELDYATGGSKSTYTSFAFLPGLGGVPSNIFSGGLVDVMRDLYAFPSDMSAYPKLASLYGPFKSRLEDYTARAAGPLFSSRAFAAPVILSTSIAHREEKLAGSNRVLAGGLLRDFFPEKVQQVNSAYMELNVPLASPAKPLLGLEGLEFQASARRDEYRTDTGTAASPTAPVIRAQNKVTSTDALVGVRVAPTREFAFRASYGTGFLPPAVDQLIKTSFVYASGGFPGVTDPRRGNQSLTAFPVYPVIAYGSGNPNLTPESSKSVSGGMIYTAAWAPGLRLSVDYTRIRKTDEITYISPQEILNYESAFPDRVVRSANLPGDAAGWAGPISAFDNSLANVASSLLEAFDVQLDYERNYANWGTLRLTGNGTWTNHSKRQLTRDTPNTDYVGFYGSVLKFKGNIGAVLTRGAWSFGWTAIYYSSYKNYGPTQTPDYSIRTQGSPTTPSQIYHDVFVGMRANDRNRRQASSRLASAVERAVQDTEITIGVRNIFNTLPPIFADTLAAGGSNGYSNYADPRMASYYISIKRRF